MRIFKTKDMFKGEKCISGKATGSFFRNDVEAALAKDPVVIDFDSVEAITQSFSEEFLGPILSHEGQDIFRTLRFKSCSEEIQAIILSAAHRFLSDAKAVS